MISFTIPGEAVPWSRAGTEGKTRFTPKHQDNFMGIIKLFAAQAMGSQPPFIGPVELSIRATYLIPASWSAKRRADAYWKTSKPDIDNIGKIIADALNRIVYIDDVQIASLVIQKRYGPIAGVIVSIVSLDK